MDVIRIDKTAEPLGGVGQRLALWAAFLGGGCAWFLQLNVNFVLVHASCASGRMWPLYTANAAFLVLSAACGVIGWRQWRLPGPTDDPVALARTRFLGLTGMLISAFFVLLIIAQGIPIFVFDPCES